MALLSGDVRRANAVFLLVLAPLIVRIWYEAVVWRLQRGPQMLGFEVLHGVAGGLVLGPLFLITLLVGYAYILWAFLLFVLQFIPAAARHFANMRLPVIGAFSYWVFFYVADLLQASDLSRTQVLLGAAVLMLIALAFVWLIYIGFRKAKVAREHAVPPGA
jgi:hypothetical protein